MMEVKTLISITSLLLFDQDPHAETRPIVRVQL